MSLTAKQWLEKIRQLPLSQPMRIMNVCGGHERSISMAGLRSALPDNIELIPGPGCPVCVCPEEDIYEAMQLALNEDIILLAFGDMLRVPVNVSKKQPRSLEQARTAGADVRPIASPTEAIQIALANRDKKVVFFIAGFETTTAPVAAMIAEGVPHNLLVLLSARLTWPAVAMLLESELESERAGFDALIAPGHVATVMGANEWQFVVEKHRLPAAIAGFSSESLLAGFYSVARQKLERNTFLDNCYTELVNDKGNQTAQKYLHKVMDVVDANWRGIGIIPNSGFALNSDYMHLDVHQHYPDYQNNARGRAGQMPAGCDCAAVVLGKLSPSECKLYGRACTPRNPVGPCMVSDEGACHIWWNSGVREKSAITA